MMRDANSIFLKQRVLRDMANLIHCHSHRHGRGYGDGQFLSKLIQNPFSRHGAFPKLLTVCL